MASRFFTLTSNLIPLKKPAKTVRFSTASIHVTPQLQGEMARHEVAPYVGPQLAEAIGIDVPT